MHPAVPRTGRRPDRPSDRRVTEPMRLDRAKLSPWTRGAGLASSTAGHPLGFPFGLEARVQSVGIGASASSSVLDFAARTPRCYEGALAETSRQARPKVRVNFGSWHLTSAEDGRDILPLGGRRDRREYRELKGRRCRATSGRTRTRGRLLMSTRSVLPTAGSGHSLSLPVPGRRSVQWGTLTPLSRGRINRVHPVRCDLR